MPSPLSSTPQLLETMVRPFVPLRWIAWMQFSGLPQRPREGASVLERAGRCFRPGAVHVAVIDPGVGSGRRALIVERGEQLFVGPDNGLFHLAAGFGTGPGSGACTVWALDRVPCDW